ncbi:hypothetical protein V1477_007166 [Vespula maculifrons]|uniref:Uncharacterized protein n=1 Tax=Vespula maculifrons TaxID=7453 RepID=A0ABD2CHS1_VESMC
MGRAVHGVARRARYDRNCGDKNICREIRRRKNVEYGSRGRTRPGTPLLDVPRLPAKVSSLLFDIVIYGVSKFGSDDACRPGGYDSDDDSGGGSCGGRGGEVGAGGGSADRSSSGGPREGSGSDGGDGDSDGDGRVDGRAGIRVDRPRKTLRTVNGSKKKQEREGRGGKENCWSRKIENVREKGA